MNLLVIIAAFIILGISACTGVIAVIEGRRWLNWRTRALTAERDAIKAGAAANEHMRHTKHWQKEAYAAWAQLGSTPKPPPARVSRTDVTAQIPAITDHAGPPAPQWRDIT